jgi:hypothetical protein
VRAGQSQERVFSNRRMSLKVRRVGEAGFCPFWFCI